jgi:hypothetical protein
MSARDLQAPVKELFGAKDSSRPSASDEKFRSTIARWAEATPPRADPEARTTRLASPDDPTVMPALPHDWSTARTRPMTGPTEPQHFERGGRRSRFAGYLVAAALAALLVGFGVWIAGRRPSEPLGLPSADSRASDRPAAAARVPTAPAALPVPTSGPDANREPTSEAAIPDAKPLVAEVAGDPLVTPKAAARLRPTPAPRVAQLRPTVSARSKESGPSTVEAGAGAAGVEVPAARTGPKMTYCAQQDDTVFKQGVVRDVPAGFEGIATKAPRPDSGLMRINISLSTERPVDDQPFFVIVRFENGGDSRVDVQRLEESASRGGLRAVSGASVPVSVSPGGMKELHRYPLTLSGGEPYGKQFVAVDPRGDSWKSGIRLVPCGD